MFKRNFTQWLPFLMLLVLSCQRGVNADLPGTSANVVVAQENTRLSSAITKSTQTVFLSGHVVDEQQLPVTGAQVACGGKTAVTDNDGYFNFKQLLTVNKDYALVQVSKDGFMKGFTTFTPNKVDYTSQSVRLMLQAAPAAQWMDTRGGTILLDKNITLTFPANAVAKEDGKPYSGRFQVIARYINPADNNFALQVPGTLAGLNDENKMVALESYGMASVMLLDSTGKRLEVTAGQKVKMEMPAAAGAPAGIPLWHFNETYGVWIKAGTAAKNGNVFTAEVNHFSTWNIDLEQNSYTLNLTLTDDDKAPLSGLQVWMYRQSNGAFIKSFITDSKGGLSLINCPSGQGMVIKTILKCDTLIKAIAAVTASRSDTLVVTSSGSTSKAFNVSGTLLDCNRAPIPNQPFDLLFSSGTSVSYALGVTDLQGRFTVSSLLCGAGSSAQAQAVTYSNNAYRYSTKAAVNAGANTLEFVTCDTLNTGTGSGSSTYQDNEVVVFQDKELEKAVRKDINKANGTLFYADVKGIKLLNLDSSASKITSLSGLQYCTSLEALYCQYQSVADLSPLKKLTGLTALVLNSNQITDITSLANLVNLNKLYISNNQVTDISPLVKMNSLESLYLYNNKISSLQAILNFLPKLTYLYAKPGNTIPQTDIDAFKAKHPACQIQ